MENPRVRDTKGESWLESIWTIYNVLTIFLPRYECLPKIFEEINIVNVYQAPGVDDRDWQAYLDDQGQAWIITPLHYLNGGPRVIRKASGGGRWDGRDFQHKKYRNTSWHVRKYILKGGVQKYKMVEYSPDLDKPKFVLCHISNKDYKQDRSLSSSHQESNMEIGHTGTNYGDKGETSLLHEPIQRGEPAIAGGNLPDLEVSHDGIQSFHLLREPGQEYPAFVDILIMNYLCWQMDMEIIIAERRKKHSTEAPVSNRKRPYGPDKKTMETDSSTQRKKQAKFVMDESNDFDKFFADVQHYIDHPIDLDVPLT